MSSLDKTALLAALACATVPTIVDGFGTVFIRQVSVAENDAIRTRIKTLGDSAPPSAFGLQLLVASVVDEAGAPVFTLDDLAQLQQAAGRKIDKLVEAVLDANGYGARSAAGNAPASGPTPSDASASASPSPSA